MTLDHTQQTRADIETAAGRAYVVRYVVTKINRAGLRDLAHAMQGRYTYDTPEAAAANLAAITGGNNTPAELAAVFGDVSQMAVRAVACYPGHHDPIGRYFDTQAGEPCDECGALIVGGFGVSTEHDRACSLYGAEVSR